MVRRANLTALKDPHWKDPWVKPLDNSQERRAEEERMLKNAKGRGCRVCQKELGVGNVYNKETRRQEYFYRCMCWPTPPEIYKVKGQRQLYREGLVYDSIMQMQENRRLIKDGMEDTRLAEIQSEHMGIELLQPLDVEAVKNRFAMMQYVASILKDGVDYGHIPGTRGAGKSLLKPGADKFRMALNIPFRMVIHSIEEDRDRVKEAWSDTKHQMTSRHWIRATVECVCEVQGQIFGSIIRASDSFEERWNGWDADMLPDLVMERAEKRAYVELIKMISGVSGEFQESLEYVDPEDLVRTPAGVVDKKTGEIQQEELVHDFGSYVDWEATCPIPEHNSTPWIFGPKFPPSHKLTSEQAIAAKQKNCYFGTVVLTEAKRLIGADEFAAWGKENMAGKVWRSLPWVAQLNAVSAIAEEQKAKSPTSQSSPELEPDPSANPTTEEQQEASETAQPESQSDLPF